MAKSQQNVEDRRLRRKSAAFRLKHDVGKAVRWSAPDAREKNADEMRDRLRRDLLSRPSGGGASRDVLEIFSEWKREEGPLFGSGDPDLEALERAMTKVASLAPRLAPPLFTFKESSSSLSSASSSEAKYSSLSESDLLSLDETCIEAARACTAFYRRIAIEEGPEKIRPIGDPR